MSVEHLMLQQTELDLEKPTKLYQREDHAIYWLGILQKTAFRCNSYLILDGNEAIIVDPGHVTFFESVKNRVSQIIDPQRVQGMILCHQDPDVASSMVNWLDYNPDIKVISSPRTNVLLPHYGRENYTFYDICKNPHYSFLSANRLRFIESPFMHFPGAFTTYDMHSGVLFSGDIFASLTFDWTLVIKDFKNHVLSMNLFHLDYMASNIATRGYADRLKDVEITAIFPQHGSIIPPEHVLSALDYLKSLQCGLDLIY